MNRIVFFDTTLRDGTQRAGISLTVSDKIKIAQRLSAFGIQYIEGGWPGSNPKDAEFFEAMKSKKLPGGAKLVAFGSTRRGGIPADRDTNLRALVESGTPAAAIFGKSWDFHVRDALGVSLEENLEMIRDSVAFLKSKGIEVIYDAEHFFDGFKANREYALATLEAAWKGGAGWLTLCDTNGGTLPSELTGIIDEVRRFLAAGIPLGIHAHNDCELAVANSVAAVQAGITMVQGTINGYGERCGNANLVSIIPILKLKLKIDCLSDDRLKDLTHLSHFVSEVANMAPIESQPFVGRNAFAHKGGVHVSALQKNPATYEHLDPALVGNERQVIISELSGRSNLASHAQDGRLSLEASREETGQVLEMVKNLEHQGYQFEGAEATLELMIRQAKGGFKEPFVHQGFRIIVEKREDDRVFSEATIKVMVGDRVIHTAADGNGPVNALDNALRKALEEVFPALKRVKLLDYKVRVLEGSDGTGAKTRVLIESGDGERTWGTVGVHENIIEASWQALVDSLKYELINNGK